ncbi:MAG TPA: hypothetical protein VM532_10910 [Burkholderiales bacterium]|nr:hypothetical protein [Burkholderiales bacterium]
MRTKPRNMFMYMLASASLCVTTSAFGVNAEESRQLANSSTPDVTPRQFFSTAIHEAGGAYKEARRECVTMSGAERSSCMKEAKTTYDNDMSEARMELRERTQ